MKKQQLAGILTGLGVLTLQRVDPGVFRLGGSAPDWIERLRPGRAIANADLRPGHWFEYLSFFLDEAEEFWAAGEPGFRRSLAFTESDADGAELDLEATAVLDDAGGASLLLQAERPKAVEMRAVLRQARSAALAQQRFHQELEKKEVLLHCIVHDLKTPLSGIRNSLDLIAGVGELGSEQKKLVDIAERLAAKQERLIQTVLQTFKAEAERLLEFRHDPLTAPDLRTLAREVFAVFEPLYADRFVRLDLEIDLGRMRRAQVRAEREGLERVLGNLLENALRHAPQFSTVTIGVARAGDDAFRVSVSDEGPGVPEEQRERLFEKFAQSGPATGSAGLGLFLCKLHVERWGGAIAFEPSPSGGACFAFDLSRA